MTLSQFLYLTLNGAGLASSLLVAVHWLRKQGAAALAVQPVVAFSLYFGLIHFFMPIYKFLSGNYRYPFDYSPIMMLYNSAVSLGVFALLLILLRNPGRRFELPRGGTGQRGGTLAFLTGFAVTLCGLIAIVMVERQIAALGYDIFRSDRILESAKIGAYTRIDTIVLPGLALMLAGLLNRPKRDLVGSAILIGATFYAARYFAMIQSRNSIILMFLILGAVYFFYRNVPLRSSARSVRTWAIALPAIIGLAWFGYFTTVARYAGVDNWYAYAALENWVFTMLDGPFGNDENLLWLLEYGHPYNWGATYVAGFTNLVPRAIWPDKPWGAGPEIRNLIYPGSYVLGDEGNSSITTGFLTEARMNLGLIGILLVGLLWAWLVRRLVNELRRAGTVFRQTMFIFVLCFMTTAFVYSEFLGFFGRLVVCIVPAIVVHKVMQSLLTTRASRTLSKHA